ncbi:MAG: transcriptional repressor LexA [Chloroflexi bacterium]|nr:transcriptional repressor LexA [Chloroflexota bacterium]
MATLNEGKKALSDRQQRMLSFIEDYGRVKGYPPSIREIAAHLGNLSTSVVSYNLKILERRGLLERAPEVSRGIKVMDHGTPPQTLIPMLGKIAAGAPIPVPGDGRTAQADEYLQLSPELLGQGDNLFALQVKGDSMIDALINDGDIVVLKRVETAHNGDMVAAWRVDEEATTLKYYYAERDKVRLQPANPVYEPIILKPENVQVQGKVVAVLRRYN